MRIRTRKHNYTVRVFGAEDEFLAVREIEGRVEVNAWLKTIPGMAWARIWNGTLEKRVDRWKESKDTSAMGIVRTPDVDAWQ